MLDLWTVNDTHTHTHTALGDHVQTHIPKQTHSPGSLEAIRAMECSSVLMETAGIHDNSVEESPALISSFCSELDCMGGCVSVCVCVHISLYL